jgi:protein disulfide-isomerase A1
VPEDRVLHFLSRMARPTVSEGLDAGALAAFKTADETVFVACLDPADGESGAVFEEVAVRYRDEFSFGTVVDPGVSAAQGVKVPAVVCYKPLDGDTVMINGFQGIDELDAWYGLTTPVAIRGR